MSKPNDQQLDQWLVQADQALHAEIEAPISLQDVQRRAERKLADRIARRKLVGTMAVVAMLLGGWMLLAPPTENSAPTALQASDPENDDPLEEFDIAACQAQRKQIDQELVLLTLERRIKQLDLQLAGTLVQSNSPELTYRRNRDSRIVFETIVDGSKTQLTKSDLGKLEVLIEGYPETDACSDARLLLAQHNRPL